MGGFPSEEKKKDVEDDILVGSILKKTRTSHMCYDDVAKSFTSTTPQNDVSSQLENFGILPDLVILKIALFMPLNELSRVYQTCKLFYHVGNSNHFWRLFFENTHSTKKEVSGEDFFVVCESLLGDEVGNSTNWKKRIFLNRYFTDDNYRRIFSQAREEHGEDAYDPIPLKTVMIGPPFVGKSSFCLRVIRDEFQLHYAGTTIGAAFFTNIFRNNITKQSYKIELWDTAGLERFRDFAPMYYRASDIIFLCFSLTNGESFYRNSDERKNFRTVFKKMKYGLEKNSQEYPVVVLMGLKCDLKEDYGADSIRKREVKHEDVVTFLKENREFVHGYVENSSRDRKNIMLSVGLALDLVSQKISVK